MTVYWRAPFFLTSSDVTQCPKCGVYVTTPNNKYDHHQFGTEAVEVCERSGQPVETLREEPQV